MSMGWYTFHVKLDDYSHKIIKKRKKKVAALNFQVINLDVISI